MGKHIDKHLGCPSWPNCDEAPMGCIVESEGDVEWYGHKDNPNAYTGNAPSTEASFYKKNKVSSNSATVIDLVINILTDAKLHIPLSPQSAMKAYDKIDEAIQELREHLTTVHTEDLDNQAYSEGERYDNE